MTIRPNLFVLGVGHSGTRIVSRMLAALGWYNGADGDRWGEAPAIRDINHAWIESGHFDEGTALAELRRLPTPWAIKDPRFTLTLHRWLAPAREFDPLPGVLWVVRDPEQVAQSHVRRDELLDDGRPGKYGHTLDELHGLAETRFREWPGPKMQVSYERIQAAVELFQPRSPA